MDVVGYMNHADLLLEDEQGVVIIGRLNYVLSIGDKVYFKSNVKQGIQRCEVDISFASNQHCGLFEDQCQIKFSGNRTELNQYISLTTVH